MDFNEIEKIFDYKFKNELLLKKAFEYNDILLKYGDNFINYYINKYLSDNLISFKEDDIEYLFNIDVINELKGYLLSDEYLLKIINKTGLQNYIVNKDNIVDLFKAILGGILKDDGLDKVCELLDIENAILNNINKNYNYYLMVNEWNKVKYKELTKYEIKDGYVSLKLNDMDAFKGEGANLVWQIFDAYKKGYEYLKDNNLLLTMTDIVGYPDLEMAINQLQDLYVKGFINEPIYKISMKGSNSGVDIWKCRVIIDGYKDSISAEDTSKKAAKKQAAYEMLKYIIDMK